MNPENIYVVLIVALLIFVVIIKLNANTIRGKIGEHKVASKLKRIPNGKIINNLTFNVSDNKTCQIDHILVCSRGVFVIETKNYAGRIYGDDSQREWTQVLNYGKVKNRFYSPVKQNTTHIFELRLRVPNVNYFNCVVFVKNNISHIDSCHVFTLSNIKKFIKKNPEIYSMDEVEMLYNKINNIHTDISNRTHVKNIKNMQRNINNNICPRCGAQVILRQGEYGKFYGCSNYPKCRFIKK